MQLFDPNDNFRDVEHTILFAHEYLIFDDFKELTSRQKIENHEQIMLIL